MSVFVESSEIICSQNQMIKVLQNAFALQLMQIQPVILTTLKITKIKYMCRLKL